MPKISERLESIGSYPFDVLDKKVDKLREKYVRVVVIATGIKSLLEKEIKEKETTKNYGIDILKLK